MCNYTEYEVTRALNLAIKVPTVLRHVVLIGLIRGVKLDPARPIIVPLPLKQLKEHMKFRHILKSNTSEEFDRR